MRTSQQIPELHPQVAATTVDGQAVIVLADSGEVTVLNETGTQVWGWIDGQRTVGEIATLLADAYALSPEGALTDASELLESLRAAMAIRVRDHISL